MSFNSPTSASSSSHNSNKRSHLKTSRIRRCCRRTEARFRADEIIAAVSTSTMTSPPPTDESTPVAVDLLRLWIRFRTMIPQFFLTLI